jgi:hypothetical protein
MQIERLAYSPAIQADETLWSWLTRVSIYHGWSADEFLRLLGFGAPWADHFRQVDVDCAAPNELLGRLAAVTGFDCSLLVAHQVEPSARTLWLDDRVAFCESCWTDAAANEVPYVRRAWLDAWCIDCPIHGCPLVTIEKVYRPRHGPDWNAAWASRADWARQTNALCTQGTTELFGRGQLVIARPPGTLLRVSVREGDLSAGEVKCDPTTNTCPALKVIPCLESWEKRLVLLAGRRWRDFSLARAFFDIREAIAWRNSAQGYNPNQPVMEPLGSLVIRSGAIRIGRALTDILFERPYRESRVANPLRRWISDLYGKPRRWLQAEILTWPAPERMRWKRQFEWGDEFEWSRAALAEPAALDAHRVNGAATR